MSESLRDQLASQLDKIEVTATEEPSSPHAETVEPAEPVESSTPEDSKPGRTAGRPRDDKGRLLPGRAERSEVVPEVQAQPVEQPKQRPPRPSSWKKDYWDHWEKIDPSLAEYLTQRESEFAKGVSTYKSEWEKAKPILDAIAPYKEQLGRHNMSPDQAIQRLFGAHEKLSGGSAEQKLAMFIKLAQDYQVPVQQMFQHAQDGSVHFNQNLLQQQVQQPDVRSVVNEILAEQMSAQEVARMRADTEKYPHFESVRETMSGLLQSGLANDLPSAYEAAVRLPKHSDIFESLQQQQREQDEKRKREEAQATALRARQQAVSPRTSTPTGQVTTPQGKGLRSALESAFETKGGGRV